MKITKRDIEIMRFINEFGFCDVPRLEKRLDLKKSQVYDIANRLIQMGLLQYERVLHGQHGVFFLTLKGARYTDLPAIDKISLAQYEHQMAILNVYLNLRILHPDAYWISERRLKHDKFHDGVGKYGHLADGILSFPDNKQIAIEVELSAKGKNRLEKILKGYAGQFALQEVWYYCVPAVKTIVKQLASKMPFIKVYDLAEFLR